MEFATWRVSPSAVAPTAVSDFLSTAFELAHEADLLLFYSIYGIVEYMLPKNVERRECHYEKK